MFENPMRGRHARNFKTNVQKILVLKSSSNRYFPENCRWVPLKTALSVYLRVMSGSWTVKLGSLSQRRLRRQREQQKSDRFRLAKQQLCTCIKLICTFLCRHCTTTTWKCLISCFVDDVNSRQRLSFSFPELSYSLLEFNSSKICQHLTNWMSWNKRDKCLK